MHPRNKDGSYWSKPNIDAVFDTFRQESKAFFKSRDAARGVGHPGCLTVIGSDGSIGYDPHKAKLVHSGQEFTVRLQKNWREFCGEPKDEDATMQEMGLAFHRTPPTQAQQMTAGMAEAVRLGISEGLAAIAAASAPKKRGRPRKE